MTGARAALAGSSLLLLLAACTSATNMNPYMPPPTGGGTSGQMASGDVSIVIDSPTSGMGFPRGTLIDVTAHVTVMGGTDFIDTAKVSMTITKMGSPTIIENGQLVLASTGGDVFEGRLSLGDLDSGIYTVYVSATSSGGRTHRESVDIEIDAGPLLIVNSPIEGKSYKRTLTVEIVAIDPFMLAPGSPTATIGSIDVPLAPAGPPDTWRGVVNFDAYDPPLFGPQLLTAAATNMNGRRTEKQVVFIIDNEGPSITDTLPIPGEVVGGVVRISATIKDNAGVLSSSVIAVIGDDAGSPKFTFPLEHAGLGVYTTLFDTARLTECKELPDQSPCIVFPTISFRASDEVGNERVVSYDFAVDNVAPIADLDPPMLRDRKVIEGILRCSYLFDPLGVDVYDGDMPNDHTFVPQVFDLRARIEDEGNRATGLKLTPISLVDPLKTDVYILDDENIPLVVDTDNNGTCDSINPLLIPTTQPPTVNNQVLKVRLAPILPDGSGDFSPDLSVPTTPNASFPCIRGPAPEFVPQLCPFQPTVAIGYAAGEPSIWTVDPINKLWCHGGQFDTTANNIEKGWACIAVATTDRAGNFSVSRPLRVYIDKTSPYPYTFNRDASAMPGMPACTGTWNRATNTTAPGTCTTIKFKPGEFCYLHDCPGRPDL